MKLEPKAKPVRIRIKSGGEEHFSLDSLKRNFSVQDLWEAVRGKSLSRWLRQQNEIELANKVDAYREIEKPSVEEYVGFSILFFNDKTFDDAFSLIDYYQSKGFQKNLHYVFVYVFDSLDYKSGKTCFHSFRQKKRDEEWIEFFEQRLAGLDDMDVVDCHRFLATLYNDRGDEKKRIFHLKKASAQLNMMVNSNGKLLLNLLEIGDYQCVQFLFNDPVTQGKVETQKWIEAFRRCKDSLLDNEQGECLYILSTLYKKEKEHDMSKMCLKMSADYGYKKAKDMLKPPSKYPELTAIRESYDRKITINLFPKIEEKLLHLIDADGNHEHYRICMNCLKMFTNIVDNNRCITIKDAVEIRDSYVGYNNTEISLVYLAAGLAWEEKKERSTAMYRQNGTLQFPFDYRRIFSYKSDNEEVVVNTAKGIKCDIFKDSPIDQLFFFMENYGEDFSFSYGTK